MAYDSAVISFTTKTDKVDLVQAAHMNSVQAELVTIETILGTNVKGNRSDLKTRLNNALDADGSILSGTAFPSPALTSQTFFRTDLNTLYVYSGPTWDALGGNLSNILFSQLSTIGTNTGTLDYTDKGWCKFKKSANVSTVTFWARLANNQAGVTANAKCLINTTLTGTCTVTGVTAAWDSEDIDVSSLTNGTTYDVQIQVATGDTSYIATLYAAVLIAS